MRLALLAPLLKREYRRLRFWPTELAVVEDMDDELLDSLEDAPRAEVAIVALGRRSTLRGQKCDDCKNRRRP